MTDFVQNLFKIFEDSRIFAIYNQYMYMYNDNR